jgi:hypothetical protein
MTAVRAGRFLGAALTAAGRESGRLPSGRVGRGLVLLGWFEADLVMCRSDGRVYGSSGYETDRPGRGVANAPEQALTSIAQVMPAAQQASAGPGRQTGRCVSFRSRSPRHRMDGAKGRSAVRAVGEARHGRYSPFLTYHGDDHRVALAVCDESGRRHARPDRAAAAGRRPLRLTQDATACLVAIGPAVHEVDCATGRQGRAEGDEPVVDVAAVAGGFAVIGAGRSTRATSKFRAVSPLWPVERHAGPWTR